jgi:hypothetical protein
MSTNHAYFKGGYSTLKQAGDRFIYEASWSYIVGLNGVKQEVAIGKLLIAV